MRSLFARSRARGSTAARPRNYVGLASSPHDPAIAIVDKNGQVVFAEGTERYLQSKRAWNAAPVDMVRARSLIQRYCDPGAELVLCTPWTNRFLRVARSIWKVPVLGPALARKLPDHLYHLVQSELAFANPQIGIPVEFQCRALCPDAQVAYRSYDHHLTHAAAACYSSPFNEALCVIVDGNGEGSSTSSWHYRDGTLTPIPVGRSPVASLGVFYFFLCEACGFDPIRGEEWKVMGLSAYGKKDEALYRALRDLIRVEDGKLVTTYGLAEEYRRIWNSPEIRRQPGQPALAVADLAHTGQAVFCDVMVELLREMYAARPVDNLVIAGGCALNSACNGQLLERLPFRDLYVFCAPADDGNAVGAALLGYYQDHPGAVPPREIQSPYLGESMSDVALAHLDRYGPLVQTHSDEPVWEVAAERLAEGKIVGWIQGRAEYGPRALGNRSILADPRSPDVKERLNAQVKFREEFRPFAPSILHEHGPEYFEHYQESPYMERALRFVPEAARKVPGVVHVDGSGRLQTVKREWNQRYYDLIAAFYRRTGVPLVLNTSFNIMGKPIVHSVEDALSVFLTTGMDVLVIGDRVYEKRVA